jgi:N4-bis(aminopropyl)spermidine synthase
MAGDLSDRESVLRRVAERAQLREGAQGIESVLRAIFRAQHDPSAEPLTGRALARIVRMPVPVVTAVRRELEHEGLVEPGPHIRLTEEGLAALHGWGWSAGAKETSASAVCTHCGGTGVLPQGKAWQQVLSSLRKHFQDNPGVDVTLDQSHCTPETNLRRVAYMHEHGALEGKDVLVLGDDDSLSAGIALAGKALSTSGRLARRVVAMDTDERILRHLRDIAVSEGVIVGLIKHDLRSPIAEELNGEFDTVATDPPYTLAGLKLFLSRAIDAVKPENGRIFLSFGHRPPDEQVQVQMAIAEMGLVIEQVIPNFNQYVGAGVLAGVSDMYLLSVTPATAPLVEGEYTGALYTGQSRPTLRMYVCTECNTQVAVGGEAGGQYSTIEELKAEGCPNCGSHSFRLIARHKVGGNGNGSTGATRNGDV